MRFSRRISLIHRLTQIAACACVGMLAAPAQAVESPRAVIEATTSAVLVVLADKALPTNERRQRVEEIFYSRVDFDTLSRLVLGHDWSQLSEEQRSEFQRQFKQNLSTTYGRNVESYANERVTIIDDRQEPRGDWTVRTKIVRHGADDISVDYRLRQTNGTWKIIDVVIEGVSLVSNYRSQFQEIMANGGTDRLLKLLKEKNARGEPLPAPQVAKGPDER